MAKYDEQKKLKPTIDESIDKFLVGDIKERAMDFVSFLRSNKMSPQWGAINSYNLAYKSRRVCIVKVNEEGFELRVNTQYNQDFNDCFAEESQAIKDFLMETITYCFACGTCKPGICINILGKDLTNACFNPVIRIPNPEPAMLELAKKLVILRRKAIAEDKAPKVTYISMKKR